MRIGGAKKVHYDSGPNMTPLVDVVMVILIFLMLAGSFGGVEHYLTSNLPVKQNGGGKCGLHRAATLNETSAGLKPLGRHKHPFAG